MTQVPEQQIHSLGPSLLVSATYDSQKQSAILKFYDPKSEQVILWADKTNHKPYCYSKLPPEELGFLTSRKDILKIETVKKEIFLRTNKSKYQKSRYRIPWQLVEPRQIRA